MRGITALSKFENGITASEGVDWKKKRRNFKTIERELRETRRKL